MQQFFADFPSVMQTLISAAFPDAKTVLLKILLLALFIGVELMIHKKENRVTPTGRHKFLVEFFIILINFFMDLEFFVKWSILIVLISIIDLIRVIWRKKHPDSDAL